MSAHSAAVQTAEDVRDEYGVPANVDGNEVTVDNTSGAVAERVLYGYCDTTAQTHGLSFRFEQPSPNHIRVVYEENDR